jgi:hypothetical protein
MSWRAQSRGAVCGVNTTGGAALELFVDIGGIQPRTSSTNADKEISNFLEAFSPNWVFVRQVTFCHSAGILLELSTVILFNKMLPAPACGRAGMTCYRGAKAFSRMVAAQPTSL